MKHAAWRISFHMWPKRLGQHTSGTDSGVIHEATDSLHCIVCAQPHPDNVAPVFLPGWEAVNHQDAGISCSGLASFQVAPAKSVLVSNSLNRPAGDEDCNSANELKKVGRLAMRFSSPQRVQQVSCAHLTEKNAGLSVVPTWDTDEKESLVLQTTCTNLWL